MDETAPQLPPSPFLSVPPPFPTCAVPHTAWWHGGGVDQHLFSNFSINSIITLLLQASRPSSSSSRPWLYSREPAGEDIFTC